MSAKDKKLQFETMFETLQLDAATLEVSPKKTIVPEAVGLNQTQSLPVIRTVKTADATGELVVQEVIGEGGMGVIQLAQQVALGRDVAIKTLRNSRRDESAVKGLLQEAVVTGHLEHPNIIPVYNLGKDTGGAPLLVMKRIEGVSWLDVLLDPRRAPSVEKVDKAWHMRILISVCDALRFAHSRGIVHRDIKPENVMIGGFGEVYLLDWGIALSIDDATEHEERFPHKKRVKGIAGTPAYMAPEMTQDDALGIDARTDVYLLGACLHEVLTGEVRHSGASLFEIMYSAWNSEPYPYSPDVSPELASIANKAMQVDPDARYQSVDAFKDALLGYLDHRQSVQLTRESIANAAEAGRLMDMETRTPQQQRRVHDLFIEARFGFKQAIKSWPGNDKAKVALHAGLTRVFEYRLARNELAAAQAMLGEFMEPNLELEAKLEAAKAAQVDVDKDIEKLQDFRDQFDFTLGARWRSGMAMALGLIWTATALNAYGRVMPYDRSNLEDYAISSGLQLGIPMILIVIMAPWAFRNRGGIQLIGVVVATMLGIFTVRTLSYYYALPVITARTMEWCIYGVGIIALGAVSERRIALVGGAYFVAALAATSMPQQFYLLLAATHMFVFGRIAYVWWPHKKKPRPVKDV